MHTHEEEGGYNREQNDGVEQASPAEEGNVEGGDVKDHRSDQNNAQTAEAGDEQRDTAEDFNGLNYRQEAGGEHGTQEGSSGATSRRLGDGEELQPEVESEDNKGEA